MPAPWQGEVTETGDRRSSVCGKESEQRVFHADVDHALLCDGGREPTGASLGPLNSALEP